MRRGRYAEPLPQEDPSADAGRSDDQGDWIALTLDSFSGGDLVNGLNSTAGYVGHDRRHRFAAVTVTGFVPLNGKSNWLEGAMLCGVYVFAALAFYFSP